MVWTTIATGATPETHGVLDFLEPEQREFLRRDCLGPVAGNANLLAVWSDPVREGNQEPRQAKLGGAGLAVVGTILLFLTRAFDILLLSYQEFNLQEQWRVVVTRLGPVLRAVRST